MLLKRKKKIAIQVMYLREVAKLYFMIKSAVIFEVDLGLKGHTYFS